MGIVADGMSCYLAHYNSASCKHAHQIKLKPQPATAMQCWMKRAWFQRIRGGGCQTLVYGGKHQCVATLFVFPPFLFHQPLQWLGVVAGGKLWLVVEAIIAFGSGVVGLSVPFPYPTPPTTTFNPLSLDSILPMVCWISPDCLLILTQDLVCGCLT